MRLRLWLALCAVGIHRWGNGFCRSRTSQNNTRRECGDCGIGQEREDQRAKWVYLW